MEIICYCSRAYNAGQGTALRKGKEDFEQVVRELQEVSSGVCGMVVEEARKVIFFG
jgi:hypothetical protein